MNDINNDITLRVARQDEKPAVWTMMQANLAELVQYGDLDRTYPNFDLYWQDSKRTPYWIEKNREPVGLIFLSANKSYSGQPIDNTIVHFYVAPEWRRQGIGEAACEKVLDTQAGVWEFGVFNTNEKALNFWRKALANYALRSCEEIPYQTICTVFRAVTALPSLSAVIGAPSANQTHALDEVRP